MVDGKTLDIIVDKFPNAILKLTKYETDSNVIGRGSHYCVYLVVKAPTGKVPPCTVIYNRPFSQDGLEQASIKYANYLGMLLGMNDEEGEF